MSTANGGCSLRNCFAFTRRCLNSATATVRGNDTQPPYRCALEAEISALKQLNQMLRDQLDDTAPVRVTNGNKRRRWPCVSYRRRKCLQRFWW
jgi:hypothetical protein